MHGPITCAPDPNATHLGCDDCLLSPECPACIPGAAAGERDIDVSVRILHRGDRLFDDGAPFDNVYMVRSGTLKACTVSASGEEQVTGFHSPGHLVGLDAIYSGRHATSAVALETAAVCSLPYEPLCRLSMRMPQVQRRLLARMSQRIRRRRASTRHARHARRRPTSGLVPDRPPRRLPPPWPEERGARVADAESRHRKLPRARGRNCQSDAVPPARGADDRRASQPHPHPRRAGATRARGRDGLEIRTVSGGRGGTASPNGQAVRVGASVPECARSRSPINSRNGISIAHATVTFTP